MKRTTIGSVCCATAFVFVPTLEAVQDKPAPAAFRFITAEGSFVRIEGAITLHSWRLQGIKIDGFMLLNSDFFTRLVEVDLPARIAVQLETSIPVASFKSDSPIIAKGADEPFIQHHLKASEFPAIEYRLDELVLKSRSSQEPSTYGFDSKGELRVAGVTREISIPVNLTRDGPNELKLSGAFALKLSDFGIALPPFGPNNLIKVNDDLQLVLHWIVADNSERPVPAGGSD